MLLLHSLMLHLMSSFVTARADGSACIRRSSLLTAATDSTTVRSVLRAAVALLSIDVCFA